MLLIAALILAALILFTAEIFLPGMIAGALGIVCLAASVIVAANEFGSGPAFILLSAELTVGVILFFIWMRYFPDTPLGRKFSLNKNEPQTGAPPEWQSLTGQTGESLTYLRPAGTAVIDGKRADVVAEGQYIPAGTKIKVVKVEGMRIVVRPI